jgi:hypothetical protein
MGKLPVGNLGGESNSRNPAQSGGSIGGTKKEAKVNFLSARSSKSVLVFCAAFSVATILFRCGGAEGVFGAEALQPFATFTTREVDIDIEDGEIEVEASFTLGSGSNGLDVAKEPVSFQVRGGTAVYSLTMPAGSFKINGVKIVTSIRQARAGAFDFEIVTERANVKGIANPVTVSLTIGDDGGSRTVRAKIE